jgi:hypothetical protein
MTKPNPISFGNFDSRYGGNRKPACIGGGTSNVSTEELSIVDDTP